MNRTARITALAALAVLAFVASLLVGQVTVPIDALWSNDPGRVILFELRLPRAILGLAIGAMLGLAGAVLQGYLRNPLADPAIVGVSASAALGAVTALFFGIGTSLFWLEATAMAFGIGSMLLLTLLVGRAGSAVGFILAGTILSSLAGSLTALLLSLSPNPYAAAQIITWLMGALTDRSLDEVAFAVPFIAAAMLLLARTGPALDALTLGDDAARSLGIDRARLQTVIVLGVGLGVGASVAVSGIVGFVGLIVPHLLRPLVGERPSALLLPSAIGGAALTLIADTLVRLSPGGAELRLGVAMALIGAPFFFLILWRMRGRTP